MQCAAFGTLVTQTLRQCVLLSPLFSRSAPTHAQLPPPPSQPPDASSPLLFLRSQLEWARPSAPKDPASESGGFRSGYGKALAQDTKEKVSYASNLTTGMGGR